MKTLRDAIAAREREYSSAIDHLRDVIENDPESWDKVQMLRESVYLARCLGRLVAGRTAEEIYAAFGAPGDFGYETPIGDALSRVYRAAADGSKP